MGSFRRIAAMVRRYLYLLRSSWPRIAELMYWPAVQMLLWGFITQFLYTNSSYVAQAFGVLLAGVLLWDVLWRGQLGLSISFLEEMWSRNLGHLFVSPLRPTEFLVALMTISLLRTIIGLAPAVILANVLFGMSIFDLGLPLVAFFFNLVLMGWAIGLALNGLVLRMGMGAETLIWVVIVGLAPISAVYYPVSVLPDWLEPVAWCLPSAYVFEGMRSILIDNEFRPDLMWRAFAINGILMVAGWAAFIACFNGARRQGQLLQMGE